MDEFSIGDTVYCGQLNKRTFVSKDTGLFDIQDKAFVEIFSRKLIFVRKYLYNSKGYIINELGGAQYVYPSDLVTTRMLLLEKEYEWSREYECRVCEDNVKIIKCWVNGKEVF